VQARPGTREGEGRRERRHRQPGQAPEVEVGQRVQLRQLKVCELDPARQAKVGRGGRRQLQVAEGVPLEELGEPVGVVQARPGTREGEGRRERRHRQRFQAGWQRKIEQRLVAERVGEAGEAARQRRGQLLQGLPVEQSVRQLRRPRVEPREGRGGGERGHRGQRDHPQRVGPRLGPAGRVEVEQGRQPVLEYARGERVQRGLRSSAP